MADSTRPHRSTWSLNGEDDVFRSIAAATTGNNNKITRYGSFDNSSLRPSSRPPALSRRTLRPMHSLVVERKAYPLPDPSQFDIPPSEETIDEIPGDTFDAIPGDATDTIPGDATDAILHPMQSLRRSTEFESERERESTPREELERDANNLRSPPPQRQPLPSPALAELHISDEQPPLPSISENMQKEKIQKSFAGNGDGDRIEACKPEEIMLQEERVAAPLKPDEELIVKSPSKVVVVYDAEKKFSTTAVDIAINDYAKSEGDVIVVVAYLQHVLSPMGMKMVADAEKFTGVNESCMRLAVSQRKKEIDYKLQESCRLQVCQKRKINLEVKVLPGANPRCIVVREIQTLQATCAIFDKNAMKDRKYYEENISCHILRIRSDGRSIETVSLFGQGLQKANSLRSQHSDTSSDSSTSSEMTNQASIWSKINPFSSKRLSSSLRSSHGRQSSTNSSRASSNLGSPPVVGQGPLEPEILEESFSFDSPKPDQIEAYVYAAAGLDDFGLSPTNRRKQSTAMAS